MERVIILAVVLLFSVTANGGEWVEQWFESDEQQKILMDQRQKQIEEVEEIRCKKKIDKHQKNYNNAKVEDPDEENYLTRYYKFRLGVWTEKCGEE